MSNKKTAKEYALGLLTRRPYAASEIQKKLQTRFTNDDVHHVVKDLVRIGLIDDSKFTDAYAYTKLHHTKWGLQKIKHELRIRGIDEKTIEVTLKIYTDDEEEILSSLARKKFLSICKKSNDPYILKNKLMSYLLHRGFSSQQSEKAVNFLIELGTSEK